MTEYYKQWCKENKIADSPHERQFRQDVDDGKTCTVTIVYVDGTSVTKTFDSHTGMQNYVYLEGDHVLEVIR